MIIHACIMMYVKKRHGLTCGRSKDTALSAFFTGFVAGHGVASRRPGPPRAAQAERDIVVPPVVHV